MERETGIEPAPSAWKAEVLPLNYSRAGRENLLHCLGGGRWIRTTEGVSQQIYSLPPLAAWVSLRSFWVKAGETARDFDAGAHCCQRSDIEPEVEHVPFLDPVFLAFQAQAAGLAGPGLAPVADEVLVTDGFGADETLFEIGMDHPGGLRRGRTALHRPGADFLDPGSEVGLQAQQLVGRPDHPVQARLLQSQVGQERVAVLVVELAQFLLDGGRDRHHLGALARSPGAYRVQVDRKSAV